MIKVFKFGGASVKDAEGVINLSRIITQHSDKDILVVVSAMGKMTNALENLCNAYVSQDPSMQELFTTIKNYHEKIARDLFPELHHPIFDELENAFVEIDWILEEEPHDEYDFIYDQLVSMGEFLSSRIVSAYLNYAGIQNKLLDARSYIFTDNTYREGKVDWGKTKSVITKDLPILLSSQIAVTQGFIGGTSENFTTTLGREGSDYSAAIFSACLNAASLTIWKDVAGVLNADPKLFPNTIKYEELSYHDALEMTFYGATVIHPKTIKPLQNAGIPLYVKPFMSPEESGTCIKDSDFVNSLPAIIVKNNQVLLTASTHDLSFISEDHLCDLYGIFAEEKVKINLLQVSAISFSACFDADDRRFQKLSQALASKFKLKYNSGLQLVTIRHFNKDAVKTAVEGKVVLLEQASRHTAQYVLK